MRDMRIRVLIACLLFAAPAQAFTVASAFSDGCHEEITEAALRTAREMYPTTTAPIAPDTNALGIEWQIGLEFPF